LLPQAGRRRDVSKHFQMSSGNKDESLIEDMRAALSVDRDPERQRRRAERAPLVGQQPQPATASRLERILRVFGWR
jgi:hypothetical protein